jgi:hypothetical protein
VSSETEDGDRLVGPASGKSAPELQSDALDGAVLSNDASFDAPREVLGIDRNGLMCTRLHGVFEGILVRQSLQYVHDRSRQKIAVVQKKPKRSDGGSAHQGQRKRRRCSVDREDEYDRCKAQIPRTINHWTAGSTWQPPSSSTPSARVDVTELSHYDNRAP